jgi:hypothetical protein
VNGPIFDKQMRVKMLDILAGAVANVVMVFTLFFLLAVAFGGLFFMMLCVTWVTQGVWIAALGVVIGALVIALVVEICKAVNWW